jgi:hypothetical protein
MAEFEDITIGQLTFKFNQPEKEIAVDIPIAGGIATLTSKPINISTYDVIVKIKEEKKFSFKTDKMITAIGSNTNNKYYKLLSGNMEKQSIVPDYEEENFKEKFNNFCFDLLNAEGDIINVTNSSRWQVKDKEVKKQSWAEVSESIEEFSIDIKTEGSEILKNGNLIDEILKVAELKAVGQEDNTALVTLIALSSFLDDSVHHISTGPPGTSKSTITDTIFDIFPSQRKESIGKSSTPASLSNMTIYEEGPQVLSRKFIRIGDLGNEEEIKAALPLLSIFKELMSKKKYDKTISIPQGDTHITKRLKISGVGSVHLSTIESNVESQYDSRAIISSPNDTSETAKTHQLNDVDRLLNDKEFKKRRLPIAAAIESLCQFIEGLESNHGDVQFANPYAHHMNEIFNIDSSKNVNRNRNHIRDLPKSVTLANIKNREIWIHEVDKDVKILITPEDYLYSLKIIGKPILKMLSDISPQQQSYIRFIEENYVFTEEGKPKDLDYYNEFAIGESSYSDEGWISKITSDVCFCKKDVTSGLGVSETTASRMLDDLCERRVIFKHQIKKNYYFPTNEFFQYSKTYSPEFFKDEELEIGGEVHQIARKEYEAAIQILKGAGYINQPISRSVFGRYK